MGIDLSVVSRAGCISGTPVVPVYRLGMADARCLGSRSHLWGSPIWPFMPTSSFGCMIFDTLIAIWFLAGAPALTARGWEAAAKFKKASVL